MLSKSLKYVAFTLMALFGLVGGLFVAGYAFEDRDFWVATGLTAAWVVPLLALSVYGVRRPTSAGGVYVAVTAVVMAFSLLDAVVDIIPRDEWGPVTAVTVFALGVSLAFLGLGRPRLAGGLMLALGALQLVAVGLAATVHGGGPGLGGSSGVMIVPVLVTGALFWWAGSLEHEQLRPLGGPHPHLRHAH